MPMIDSSAGLLALIGLAAYLLGSVPFGLVISRVAGLGDIRQIGSGNIGATNVLRTGSKGAALATVLLDAGKGLVSVLIARAIAGEDAAQLAGLCAFLGHLYPIWLKFKGGKGVATFLGVLLALSFFVGLFACAAWLVAFLITRISSMSALVASVLTPMAAALMGHADAVALIIVMAALLIWKHRENMQRLMSGTEPKSSFSKK